VSAASIREQAWQTLIEANANAHRLTEIGEDMADGPKVVHATKQSSAAEFEKVAGAIKAEAVRATLLLLATAALTGQLQALAEQLREAERG
jgi:hypothetical protein